MKQEPEVKEYEHSGGATIYYTSERDLQEQIESEDAFHYGADETCDY